MLIKQPGRLPGREMVWQTFTQIANFVYLPTKKIDDVERLRCVESPSLILAAFISITACFRLSRSVRIRVWEGGGGAGHLCTRWLKYRRVH